MHETFTSLLDLHEVNIQRQLLVKERRSREAKVTQAAEALASATAAREQAETAATSSDALIRQYTADIKRCDHTIEEMREKQMSAKTNKEYLACINGVEEAKSEKRLREQSLADLNARIDTLKEAAEKAKQAEAAAAELHEAAKLELESATVEAESEAELERIYQEKKAAVDAKFLEVYERLITAKHPMPLMKVDGATRATPMGNRINTQALEQLRLGQLVTDSSSNAILYVDE